MPMAINTREEYDKVVNVSWFSPEKTSDELRYISRQTPLPQLD